VPARQQAKDLPQQLQQLKAEYIKAGGAATVNALTLLLEDVVGSCRGPALRKGRYAYPCTNRARMSAIEAIWVNFERRAEPR
jgi:hypothetical protein